MNFRKVSVLVPTRKRLGYLERMLKTYEQTVGDPTLAEIIFRCDSDDPQTIEFLCHRPFKILIGPREEGYKSLPRFFNEMARIADGDLLMCCNDDVVFASPSWPAALLAEASKYPDGIFNLGVNAGLNDDFFPFSIVSRRLNDLLGFINDERLLFSDVFLLDVAKAFNRAIRVTDVTIAHDWAGHGHDETRVDANRHEFAMVFKDATGAWTDSYRMLHDNAVREAVNKIRAKTDISADVLMSALAAYQPCVDGTEIWPPRVRCDGWRDSPPPNNLHYSRLETAALLRVMSERSLFGGTIVLTNYTNGLPNLFWSQLFERVIAIHDGGNAGRVIAVHDSGSAPPIRDGKNEIHFGNVDDAKFMYRLMDGIKDLRVVLLDDVYYNNLTSSYFLLRSRIQGTGMMVFTNAAAQTSGFNGAHRFLVDLQRGFLDNRSHDIVYLDVDPNGSGTAYEIIGSNGPQVTWRLPSYTAATFRAGSSPAPLAAPASSAPLAATEREPAGLQRALPDKVAASLSRFPIGYRAVRDFWRACKHLRNNET